MDDSGSELRKYAQYAGLGIELAGAMIIPLLIGLWIDRTYDLRPYGSLGGALLGFFSIFWTIYKIAKKGSNRHP